MTDRFIPWRRTLIAGAVSAVALAAVPRPARSAPLNVEVWKDPHCGCCADWVAILQKAGFRVKVHDVGNNAKRAALGMPQQFGSCHTAVIEGYVIEGHVPVADIVRLLAIKPKALGLAVPGMPVGSPGMDGALHKGRRDPFDVLLIGTAGSSSVFRSIR